MGKYFTYDKPSGTGRVETPKNYDDSKDWEYKKNKKLPTQVAIQRLAKEALGNNIGYRKSVNEPNEKNANFYEEDIAPAAKYLWYLAKHKYNMIGPGAQIGLPATTIIAHDYSKLRPKSVDIYGKYFFGPNKYRKDSEFYKRWRERVNIHYNDEDHHNYKAGKPVSVDNQMESVVDWYSVNKSNGQTDLEFEDWYKLNRDKFLNKLYPETIKRLDKAVQKERAWWNIF